MPAGSAVITYGLLLWAALAGFLLLTLGKLARRTSSSSSALDDSGVIALEPFAADSSAAAVDDRSEDAYRFFERPLRLLVVDDDPGLRALVRTSFEIADIEVGEADSAKSAAAKIG